jgi:hypothetical protein
VVVVLELGMEGLWWLTTVLASLMAVATDLMALLMSMMGAVLPSLAVTWHIAEVTEGWEQRCRQLLSV